MTTIKLIDQSLKQLTDSITNTTPTPAGGSVSAIGGALSASLAIMIQSIILQSFENKELQTKLDHLQSIKERLLNNVDHDKDAFDEVMNSYRLSKNNPQRVRKIQESLKKATEIPLEIIKDCTEIIQHIENIKSRTKENMMSDLMTGYYFAIASCKSAIVTAEVNLKNITNDTIKNQIQNDLNKYIQILKNIDEFKKSEE